MKGNRSKTEKEQTWKDKTDNGPQMTGTKGINQNRSDVGHNQYNPRLCGDEYKLKCNTIMHPYPRFMGQEKHAH